MPRTLFGSTTRATAVMHDGQYQPGPLKQPRNCDFFELVAIASIFFLVERILALTVLK